MAVKRSPWVKPDIPPAMLAEFEARHGKVRVQRTSGPPASSVSRPSASVEFGERIVKHPALQGSGGLCVPEFRFHPVREWRFDWAFPAVKLAVEIEGWGRHQTYTDYRGDCEKYNSAILHGWRVLRFMAGERDHISDWVDTTVRALCGVDDL